MLKNKMAKNTSKDHDLLARLASLEDRMRRLEVQVSWKPPPEGLSNYRVLGIRPDNEVETPANCDPMGYPSSWVAQGRGEIAAATKTYKEVYIESASGIVIQRIKGDVE